MLNILEILYEWDGEALVWIGQDSRLNLYYCHAIKRPNFAVVRISQEEILNLKENLLPPRNLFEDGRKILIYDEASGKMIVSSKDEVESGLPKFGMKLYS